MTRKQKENLYWAGCLVTTLVIGYFAMRYFWPWFVKWCLAQ